MAVESKPLFHPEVLRQQVRSFVFSEQTVACQPKLHHWAGLITSGCADTFKESELLPDYLTDIFCGLLGYTGPLGPADPHNSHNSHPSHLSDTVHAESPDTYTLSRERHVEVDGKFADAVLGRFQKDKEEFIAVVEGKGTRDPLERPFAGRRMSAVDQACRYAIIDVDILGHIFEQSITDLERLRQSLEPLPASGRGRLVPESQRENGEPQGRAVPAQMQAEAAMPALPVPEVGRRRKQEGAVYTPAFITRYLVEQALGGVLKARFETLRRQHEAEAAGSARKVLADPNAYDLAALNEPQRKALIRFWEAWQEALKCLRILDPACGSGAFLIEAFDQLHTFYETSNARLEELRGQRTLFDLDRQILQHNLYGVDLNAEAVQICQLSLWIKTAARGKRLTSLDHTIREGNSIISDPAVHPKAFDWQAAFPEVFAQGGFDVVVGRLHPVCTATSWPPMSGSPPAPQTSAFSFQPFPFVFHTMPQEN
jgi:hypothetical protein